MSVYRFARATTVLVFLRRYRLKLFYIIAAIALALVTDWLYGDVASILNVHAPHWALVVLVIKTIIIYASFCFLLWQIRPSEWQHQRESEKTLKLEDIASTSKLDKIAKKETLEKRRDAILRKSLSND